MNLLYVKIDILSILRRKPFRGMVTFREAAILAPSDNSFSLRTPEGKGKG